MTWRALNTCSSPDIVECELDRSRGHLKRAYQSRHGLALLGQEGSRGKDQICSAVPHGRERNSQAEHLFASCEERFPLARPF